MYLTRMYLNARRRSAVRLLASPQRMHAAVMVSFPPVDDDDVQGRTLWRIDRQGDRTALIVASAREPDMSCLVEQAGWQTGEMWQTRSYGPLLESLCAGQVWAFRLTANPTYAGRREGWSDTKPRAHTTVGQQEQWFKSRCGGWGFAIPNGDDDSPEFHVAERDTLRFRRGGGHVVLATATYEGLLEVTDPELLRRALTAGIGRAKAYGCGLLTLAPAGRP